MKKKIFNSFIFTLLSSGIFFIFNFFIAKILGAEIYGQIIYFLSFIQIISLLISINYASLYMGNKIKSNDQNTFSLFVSIETLLFLIISIPSFIILKYFINDGVDIVLILFISYLSVFLVSVGLEYNTNKDVPASILYSMLIPRVLLVILFIFLMILGASTSKNYLFVYLFATASVVGYFVLKFKPTWYIKKEIFTRIWKFYLLGVIGSSFTNIAQILQKAYAGYTQLATLAIVLLLFSGLNLIGTVLVKLVLPKIHEYYRDDQLQKIGELYSNNTFLVLVIIAPIIFILVFNIPKITNFLGEEYFLLPIYFYILLAGYLVDLLTGITGNILRSTENEKYEIFNEIIRLFSGLSMIYILRDHEFGVVIAISLSMVFYNMLKYIEVFYLFRFLPISKDRLKYAIIYILFVGMSLFIISNLEMFFISIILTLSVLGVNYYLIYTYVKSDLNLLKGYK